MATWPLARFIDFIKNSVPVISADFLNAVQDWVAGFSRGEISIVGLSLDATGGQSVTPLKGALQVVRSVFGNYLGSLPTPLVNLGEVNLSQLFAGWAIVYATGKLARGNNIKSIQRISKGVFDVEFNIRLDSDLTFFYPVWITPRIATQSVIPTYKEFSSSPSKVEVYLWDKNGAPIDCDFSIGVVGA